MHLSKFIKFHNYVFEDLLIGIHSTQGLAATAKDEVHSVHWGINPPPPPSKTPPPLSCHVRYLQTLQALSF